MTDTERTEATACNGGSRQDPAEEAAHAGGTQASETKEASPASPRATAAPGQREHGRKAALDAQASAPVRKAAPLPPQNRRTPGKAGEARSDSPPDVVAFRRPRTGRMGLFLVLLAVLSGLATYTILTGLTPLRPTPQVVAILLWINAVLVLAMAGLIGWQVARLIRARRQGLAGAALHGRVVALLSLFAAVPAVIVAVFASVTLNRGLDAWFSQRMQDIVSRTVAVAQSYIQEKADLAKLDAAGLASDIERNRLLFINDRRAFIQRLGMLAAIRGLPAVYIIDNATRQVDVAVQIDPNVPFRSPPPDAFRRAAENHVVVMGPGPGDNIIRALKKLAGYGDRYLYVYRPVSADVLRQLAKARAEQEEYQILKRQRFGLQVTFALMYAGVTFIFLMAAVWFGLWFADRLVEPVVGLIRAAREVARGNFDVEVPAARGTGDIGTLIRVFNQMTRQLKSQREQLLAAYHELDERRRFTEAVLEGASTGVLGLDHAGRIKLANRSALQLLRMREEDLVGHPLAEVLPEFLPVLECALGKRSGCAEEQVMRRVNGEERTFVLRITTERGAERATGYVITFDDVTDLLAAQRNAAWADVARRIAHEIKNPLTPIQLSAERLKRRYAREIRSRPEIFEQCTDTIIRQVEDIGRMVDEFSAFARMPAARPEPNDLVQVLREALLLQRVSSEDITFELDLPKEPLVFAFDRRLITQAVTNLVKNARESIEARLEKQPEPPGRIRVELFVRDGEAHIRVIDNGRGLPRENRSRLTEPYMTTREKGTGLGLAIVQRIMEEHGGRLMLEDAPEGQGAAVSLILPLQKAAADARADGGSHSHEAAARAKEGDSSTDVAACPPRPPDEDTAAKKREAAAANGAEEGGKRSERQRTAGT